MAQSPFAGTVPAQERLRREVAKFAHILQQRGLPELPADVVEDLQKLPLQYALQCLASASAGQVRSPIGLLKWKVGKAQDFTPAGAASSAHCSQQRATAGTGSMAGAERSAAPPVDLQLDERSASAVGEAAPPHHPNIASQKRARTDVPDVGEVPESAALTTPYQHCPGCGVQGPVLSNVYVTQDGVLEIMIGRHACGASWSATSVPVGIGGSALLNVWTMMPDPVAVTLGSAERSAALPLAPRCTACGIPLSCLLVGPTPDANKAAVHLVCGRCRVVMFGSRVLEGRWVHHCLVGRRP